MNVKKLFLSTLFVAMLVVPTVLGAIPLAVNTPIGVVSAEVQEAEARNRNTSANRPRSASVRNTGARLHQNFSANRTSYRVEVRQSTARADIRVGLREGQQHRWRIDRRNASGNWVNGSYNSWRARATRNINRDVRVNVNQGQERRLRLQIRDRNGNIRTLTFNVQRASGNTWGANLRANAGTFNRSFDRAVTSYTLTIPYNRTAATQVGMRSAQERAMSRSRVRIQNADGTWRAWSSWSSYSRGQTNRNVGTIPQGRRAEVQFMIRGAWTNRSNTPLRTRTYTVRVERPTHSPAQLIAMELLATNWGFSRGLLIDYLVWEGFSRAVATQAVDSLGINWYEQAVLAARTELRWENEDGWGISRYMMVRVLLWLDFTPSQAAHGADNSGANWYEQAVIQAQLILRWVPNISRADLVHELTVWEGFTSSQANHAANVLGVGLAASLSVQLDSAEPSGVTESLRRDESQVRDAIDARRREAIRQLELE